MPEGIRVAVIGAAGRMGREVLKAVSGSEDMELVAAVGRTGAGEPIRKLMPGADLPDLVLESDAVAALDRAKPDVVVDFSAHEAIEGHALAAIERGISPVIGTTGLSASALDAIDSAAKVAKAPALYIPNFAIGAVLMMRFSEMAAKWMPDVEIIELHHEKKLDAPSGTALLTAELVAAARAGTPVAKPNPMVKAEGALGGRWKDIPVHSIRLPGLLAHQQVMFGVPGETLTIRHDSTDRAGFMPGVLLCVRRVRSLSGLTVGLDKLLFD